VSNLQAMHFCLSIITTAFINSRTIFSEQQIVVYVTKKTEPPRNAVNIQQIGN